MQQYFTIKKQYEECILLFRVGDFYETFEEDARKISKVLGIALTKRSYGNNVVVDLAGFPCHARELYIPKIVAAGFKVAVCEQLEEPSKDKKLIDRGVVEVITPGLTPPEMLRDFSEHNFIMSLAFNQGKIGCALADVTTGDFFVAEGDNLTISKILNSFLPNEILLPKNVHEETPNHSSEIQNLLGGIKSVMTYLPGEYFSYQRGVEKICEFFNTSTIKGFGISDYKVGVSAVGSLLTYMEENMQKGVIFRSISRLDMNDYLWLDSFTIRNLEVLHPLFPEGYSLRSVLDECKTPMGSRLLTRLLSFPPKDIEKINKLLSYTTFFYKNFEFLQEIRKLLKKLGDIERLTIKISTARITPREMLLLVEALKTIEKIKSLITECKDSNVIDELLPKINLHHICDLILNYIREDASGTLGSGQVIKPECNEKLKEYHNFLYNSKQILAEIHKKEILRTNIPSLKIGYNQVFGYYLEVSKAHKDKVPSHWIRKQTLTNAERYVTEELKEIEEKILDAEEKVKELEKEIYDKLLRELRTYVSSLLDLSSQVAYIDLYSNFAEIARNRNYTPPQLTTEKKIKIIEGRHPVIELTMPPGKKYMPNDLYMNEGEYTMAIITGPNMAGKSAYLRQNALIILMAHIGCYVPAQYATIPVCDKIFSRVGATDNIALGESTFMVEMIETASILNNLSPRSFILLDEIGRGTSTYDGMSIAWAIVEYLYEHKTKPFVLFATHYHELASLEKTLPGIVNFHVLVRREEDKLIFLHIVERGHSSWSFGIDVAKMAGLPKKVIEKAQEISKKIQLKETNFMFSPPLLPFTDFNSNNNDEYYKRLQGKLAELKSFLLPLDVNTITPLEALIKLKEVKEKFFEIFEK